MQIISSPRKSIRLSNYFTVPVDFTSSTWNTVASHEFATVTGMVYVTIIPECTSTLTDAADGASIQMGIEGSTAAMIASTGAAGAGGNTINTGEIWADNTPTDLVVNQGGIDQLSFLVPAGKDIGFELTGAALTGGSMIFHIFWEPIDSTGNVTAGAGGSL